MKLQNSPRHPIVKQLAIWIASCGMGLVIGVVLDQPEQIKLVIGLGLAILAFVVMVFSETGLL